MYTGTNPSALRSQQDLSRALWGLLQRFALRDISITMVCQQAKVSRQTFYKMFASLEDVVRYLCLAECASFELDTALHAALSTDELIGLIFEFFDEHIELVRILIANELQPILQESIQNVLADTLALFRSDNEAVLDESNRIFIAGGMAALFVHMAQQDAHRSVEERTQKLSQLLNMRSFVRREAPEDAITPACSGSGSQRSR